MTQSEALDILKMGGNVFLTGAAGSGKTYVLNEYINYLKNNRVEVAITASTGIASTHLNGMTIHAWTGMGIKDRLTDSDIDDLMEKQYLYKRFERTKVLVIDEVSMLHHYRLDMIDWICRSFKRNERPFGGLQVILCGDFFQLPPISRGEVLQNQFSYKAESWENANFTICYLSENYRQQDDDYLKILNEIRSGRVSEKSIKALMSRQDKNPDIDVQPTKLFTHNADVDEINHQHLASIKGSEEEFKMTSRGQANLVESLKKSCLAPETLRLKEGARVMFVKNNYEVGYVNGTLGVVTGFNSYNEPLVRIASGRVIAVAPVSWKIEEEGKVKAEISQLPLRLAWAITVHKSQGMSLDAMEADLSKSFTPGMGYVALSRVRSLSGMKLLGFNKTALQVHPEVLVFDINLQETSDSAVASLAGLSKKEIEKTQEEFLERVAEKESGGKSKKEEKSTTEKTLDMILEKISLEEIAEARGVKQETIISHIEDLMQAGNEIEIDYLQKEFKRGELEDILDAFQELDTTTLSPVYNYLAKNKKKPTYLKLRLARLFL
jgi:ATP-dependent exoDNAse (exonuclease V) alpha subunit